jgi:outer membrane protein insertion porin family
MLIHWENSVRKFIRFSGVVCGVLSLSGAVAMAASTDKYAPVEIAQSSATINEIVVQGTQRIEPETVKSYLLIREGDQFDARRMDRSLKSLFATGLFADVNIDNRGSVLVVNVVENPVINRIAFEGNDKLDDEELEAEVTLRPRVIYTRTKVQNDVKRILTVYRRNGRFAVTVEPKVIQLEQNRVDLVFEINEGEVTSVSSIRFVGNKEFSDRRLREIVQTRESAWWRFLSSDDTYDPDRLTLDRELLRRFYLTDGFADFRVLSSIAELTPDRKDFFITFTVDEGDRYQFGPLKIDARLRDLKSEQLQDVIEVEDGDWYDITVIDDIIDGLTNRVGELGYAFVDVRPRVNRNRETKKIDVTFEVNEGPRVFVERIDISGNVRTIDKVIRREFQIVEGDAFNSAKIRRSKQRISNLGFFEKINIQQVPGTAPDKAVVSVEVEEKSTGQISVGAGYSSTVGPVGDFSISEANFLGRGQNINLTLQIAATRSQIDFAFTEPYFLDREIRAGFDLFHTEQDLQDVSSFDMKRTGFSLRAGYPISDNLSQSWNYVLRRSVVKGVPDSASSLIRDSEGTEFLSELGHTVSFNKLDSNLRPSSGYNISLSSGLAGLGGDLQHLRNTLNAANYYEIADEFVVKVSGRAGYIVGLGKDVHLLERYHLGGDSLRGFATRGVDPRDTATDDALGGEWMYSGTLSMSFPVGLPAELGVSGRMFTDMGSVGKVSASNSTTEDPGSLRISTGLGLTWASPFGPLGMDLGFPLLKEDFDEDELIRINFGTRF